MDQTSFESGRNALDKQTTLLSTQAAVEAVANEYGELWEELSPQFVPPDADVQQGPPITADDILEAARTFSPDTGLGVDSFSPRSLVHLPRGRLEQLAALLNDCERQGRWPTLWQLVMIVLIPKGDGGRRPHRALPHDDKNLDESEEPFFGKVGGSQRSKLHSRGWREER